jgi:hypothetical protein
MPGQPGGGPVLARNAVQRAQRVLTATRTYCSVGPLTCFADCSGKTPERKARAGGAPHGARLAGSAGARLVAAGPPARGDAAANHSAGPRRWSPRDGMAPLCLVDATRPRPALRMLALAAYEYELSRRTTSSRDGGFFCFPSGFSQ